MIAVSAWGCRGGGPGSQKDLLAHADGPAAPVSAPAHPPAAGGPAASSPAAPASIAGIVAETLEAGGYTYIKVRANGQETWAAVLKAKVQEGQSVTISVDMALDAFESPTLGRRFDHILFGKIVQEDRAGSGPPAPHHPAAAPADLGAIRVARAGGAEGHTVAEVHAQRAELTGKNVAVRGRVVKFLPGIMEKNWLHLRDGTGSADGKDNDLTVTTIDVARVGDEVLVKGKVQKDKDLGAGYQYAVIVEGATVVK